MHFLTLRGVARTIDSSLPIERRDRGDIASEIRHRWYVEHIYGHVDEFGCRRRVSLRKLAALYNVSHDTVWRGVSLARKERESIHAASQGD